MQQDKIVVGLDIGTTKICAIVGAKNEYGKLEVLGMGKAVSDGVIRGIVTNIDKTVLAIEKAVAEASEQSGIEINVVNVGIAGQHIKSSVHHGSITRDRVDDEITVEDCKKFYQERYNLKEANIFVAGKLDNSIFNLINESFGKLSINDVIPAFNFGKVNQKSEFQYVDKPDAIQSSLRIGKPLVKINHPDFNKLQVLNTIFGGYFGSRLMANIREDKGYTYGIGSVMMNRMNMGNLIIYTEVGKEVTQPALDEIRKEITTLQTVKPSEEELYKVKNYMLGSLLQNTDGAFDMLSRYKTLYYHNLPNNYYEQYIKEINSTTAEEILKLAQTYYNDLTFVVAGSQKVD